MWLLRILEQWAEKSPRLLSVILIFTPLYALYFLINHFPIFEPRPVPMLPGESDIPLLGWTAFVYISVLFEILLAVMLFPQRGFGKVTLGAVIILLFHLVIFALLPTAYPRANESDAPWAIALIRNVDQANNAFPSLHVSISAYIAFMLWRIRGWQLGMLFAIWAALIALSTLTTKQHFALDVVAGLVIAAFMAKSMKIAFRVS